MQELIQVFGRFHPLVLHAPIGMLAAMVIVEMLSWNRADESVRRVFSGLAWLTALAAGVAVLSGWLLSREGGYDQIIVDRHFNLAIATAALTVLLAVSSHFKSHTSPRRGLLVLTMLVLVPTGHLGSSMTHGENFLFEPLQDKIAGSTVSASNSNGSTRKESKAKDSRLSDAAPSLTPSRESPAQPSTTPPGLSGTEGAAAPVLPEASGEADPGVFASQIVPILSENCYKCHSAVKKKGGLALDTPADILLGGDSGSALEAGDPDASEILVRLRLPLDQKHHMPPKGKPQPTEAQIAAIEAWIKSGASMSASVTPTPTAENLSPTSIKAASPSTLAVAEPRDSTPSVGSPAVPGGPPPASEDALAALRAALVNVEPVSQQSTLLIVSFAAIAPTVDDAAATKLLAPLKDNLADVSLARTKITDTTAEFLAGLPRLRRLDLRGTAITPAGVTSLARSLSIQELILAQTKLCDDITPTILGMGKLTHVYLWGAGVSPESIAKLRADRPELDVDAGDRLVTESLGTEGELKFSSDAPLPGATPVASAPASLTPINTTCPVSGNPINPKYLVVYDGKVIGFCCPNCPKDFWADPEKYLAALNKK